MQVLLDGKKFFSLVLIKNKLGCKLGPRRGSFSVPITNLSMLPRSTLPLLPPVMNIEISVHNAFYKFRNHLMEIFETTGTEIKSDLVLAV